MDKGIESLKPGKYAILYRDNWDGEGDTYHTLANLESDGRWLSDETGKELLEYDGDEILKAWPLDDGADTLALIAALEQAQQEYQTIEQKLISAAVYIETLESEPRKTNLKQLNEIAGLKRTCEELETARVKPVNMPDAYAIRPGHPINEDERSVMIPKDGGNWYSRLDIEHALRVAGVRFEGGE